MDAAPTSIYLLESDVNELAQAKGANVAGLQVVFSRTASTSTISRCSIWRADSGGI